MDTIKAVELIRALDSDKPPDYKEVREILDKCEIDIAFREALANAEGCTYEELRGRLQTKYRELVAAETRRRRRAPRTPPRRR